MPPSTHPERKRLRISHVLAYPGCPNPRAFRAKGTTNCWLVAFEIHRPGLEQRQGVGIQHWEFFVDNAIDLCIHLKALLLIGSPRASRMSLSALSFLKRDVSFV